MAAIANWQSHILRSLTRRSRSRRTTALSRSALVAGRAIGRGTAGSGAPTAAGTEGLDDDAGSRGRRAAPGAVAAIRVSRGFPMTRTEA